MKYSRLIYEGARAGADFGDSSMTYVSFLRRGMASDADFSPYLDKAYHEANAFLQRVSALGKVPCRMKVFEPIGTYYAPELNMGDDFLTAVAVFQFDDDRKISYTNLSFRKLGNKVMVVGPFSPNRKIYVQYRPKVPVLSEEDIAWITDNGQNQYTVEKGGNVFSFDSFNEAYEKAEELQVDLTEQYGISDEVLMLGVDWIRARIKDDVSKGHSEEIEVESRLNDIESDEFIYLQRKGGKVRV